jgi:pyruvate kinase
MPFRRTKIIATLGPATDKPEVLERLLRAGTDLIRINFSHGTAKDQERRVNTVRALADKLQCEIGIIADLQGPKLRIARFQEGKVYLEKGAEFILDASLASDAGTAKMVGIDYKNLPQDVHFGDKLLLDDGRLVLRVQKVTGTQIACQVEIGGWLSDNKGLNRQGGGLSAKALTEKDKQDLHIALSLKVDYIAVSFPRNAQDIAEARSLIESADADVGLIAKIERTEAVQAIDEIINASDAVMVARGDLGVEIGDVELPAVQKDIINRARAADKAVIIATQMMESMIHNSIPTRAEVFDVANAVLDGTDAVMLSAETATGEHPIDVVSAMANICLGAERQPKTRTSRHRVECQFKRIDEAIAMATMYTANHFGVKCIIALTESGSTPLWMSRIRSGIPIFGLCRFPRARRRMKLYRGVYPIKFDVSQHERYAINRAAVLCIEQLGFVEPGDLVILTKGDIIGLHGGANAMKILKVGNVV